MGLSRRLLSVFGIRPLLFSSLSAFYFMGTNNAQISFLSITRHYYGSKKAKKNWAVCSLISRVSFCCKPTVLLITWVYEFPIPKFHEIFTNFVTKKQRFKRNQKATSFGYFVFHVRTIWYTKQFVKIQNSGFRILEFGMIWNSWKVWWWASQTYRKL